jgi:hypothetical protein
LLVAEVRNQELNLVMIENLVVSLVAEVRNQELNSVVIESLAVSLIEAQNQGLSLVVKENQVILGLLKNQGSEL